MAFDLQKLNAGGSPGAKGRSPVIYTYVSSADSLATIKGSGYFNGAASRLKTADVIIAISTSAATGAAGASVLQIAVSASNVVTVTRSADLS